MELTFWCERWSETIFSPVYKTMKGTVLIAGVLGRSCNCKIDPNSCHPWMHILLQYNCPLFLSRGESYLSIPGIWSWLGGMACFQQWDVGEWDVGKGLKGARTLDLAPSCYPWELWCPHCVKKPGPAFWRMRGTSADIQHPLTAFPPPTVTTLPALHQHSDLHAS